MPDPRYGSSHQKERARWEPVVESGMAYCCEVRCVNPGGRWIKPGSVWHLCHTPDGTAYLGPGHSGCNLSEAGHRGNPRGRKKRTTPKPQGWRPTRAW